MCHRLKQSGHVEKATALFQAQLEYNLFAPSPDMVLSASDLIEFFQAFWESTAPRLGEDNACGWKHWIENQGNVKPFVPFVLQDEDESLEQEIVKKHSDKHDIWFAMETLRTSRHWLAWKPDGSTEDDECEDLERLVVSDDVTFALFSVSKPLQKMKLLLQFLDFLGVPVEKHHCTVCRIGISDLDAAVKLENISDIFRHHCHASCALNLPEERQITFMNRHKFIENLFIQMFSLFRSSETIWNSLMMMYIDFLEQKVLAGKDQWSEKQLKAKGKEMRSVMKKLLFEEPFRHSKLAWLRYAVMEWCIGRQDDARKALYHVLMSLVHGNTDDSKPPTMYHPHSVELMVYRTYAEMEMGLIHGGCLLKGQKGDRANRESGRQKALQVLVSMCIGDFTIPSEDFSITTIQLVKCKKHYTNIQDELLHNITEADMPSDEDCYTVLTLGSSLEHWVVCYAIFIYITTGLAAAVEVFNEVYTSLGCTLQKKEGKGNEQYDMILDIMQRVTESHLFLLNFHIRQECAPLRTIRVPLSEAMQRYPANVNILWSYIMLELRGAFTVNLRRHLTKLCCTSKSSLTWTLSIIAQLQHLEKLKMVAMETKTSSVPDVCRHYLLLWRTYLRFEIKHAKPETAKKVFYEAIQHCPWAKCLYMDYIEAFPASTQEVVDLMVERELRVHVPLEEIEILMEEA
ncbi:hypothetical protein LSH36_269g04022 [Paralvinella palmiformis]|uniref:Uncharacterized protein n=1 Tax=Paralvinella palmiformis TaxID=53620 RepID=A0AAD9JJZ6_9ANNE|nr:hypothetical protein LSH36_269g04022 [Paralvinella palmiformis]